MHVRLRWFFLLIIVVSFSLPALAQSDSLADLPAFNEKRLAITQTGMWVLGSWALGNIAIGAIGSSTTSGSMHYFHQMNALWNTVNLGLAGVGLYQTLHADPNVFTLAESIKEQSKLEKLLLFNAGLDVAYVATGLYLLERADRSKRTDLFNGYGRSLILQGGFLFAFDLLFYYALHRHAQGTLMRWMEYVHLSPTGVGMHIQF